MDWKRHLSLIIKEAMNNCARHSGAKAVVLKFILEKNLLQVEISDDGHGFDPSSYPDGKGLRSISERALRLSGRLSVETSIGVGTTITFVGKIPVSVQKSSHYG
jgi:signal transduction histidine kinase